VVNVRGHFRSAGPPRRDEGTFTAPA